MQFFSGIMSATRKITIEQRATTDASGAASVKVHAVPFETAHCVTPLGCTFGDRRVESSFPLFVEEPTMPTKMQPHSESGLQQAREGLTTCKTVLDTSSEHDEKRYYVRKQPGDKRP